MSLKEETPFAVQQLSHKLRQTGISPTIPQSKVNTFSETQAQLSKMFLESKELNVSDQKQPVVQQLNTTPKQSSSTVRSNYIQKALLGLITNITQQIKPNEVVLGKTEFQAVVNTK